MINLNRLRLGSSPALNGFLIWLKTGGGSVLFANSAGRITDLKPLGKNVASGDHVSHNFRASGVACNYFSRRVWHLNVLRSQVRNAGTLRL